LSFALPLINININSINIQGRIIVLELCPSAYCHLSINQVSIKSILNFQRYGPTGIRPLWKSKWLMGDNSVNIKGRIMVIVHSSFSHCHLSTNQVLFQSLKYFQRYGPDRHPLWRKKWLREDNSINIQGIIMVLGSALPLTDIYL